MNQIKLKSSNYVSEILMIISLYAEYFQIGQVTSQVKVYLNILILQFLIFRIFLHWILHKNNQTYKHGVILIMILQTISNSFLILGLAYLVQLTNPTNMNWNIVIILVYLLQENKMRMKLKNSFQISSINPQLILAIWIILIVIESFFPFLVLLLISYSNIDLGGQYISFFINFLIILFIQSNDFNKLKNKKNLTYSINEVDLNIHSHNSSSEVKQGKQFDDEISFRPYQIELHFDQVLGLCEDIIEKSSEGVIVLTSPEKLIYCNQTSVKFLLPNSDFSNSSESLNQSIFHNINKQSWENSQIHQELLREFLKLRKPAVSQIKIASKNKVLHSSEDEDHSQLQEETIFQEINNHFNIGSQKKCSIITKIFRKSNNLSIGGVIITKYRKLKIEIMPVKLIKEVKHIFIIIKDISQRKYIQKLKREYDNKSKNISYISHEFRNPLTSIIQMLSISAQICTFPECKKYVQISQRSAKYLYNMANIMLDIAQLKAGKYKPHLERQNLKSILQECLQMFELQCSHKKIYMNLNYDEYIPSDIKIDCTRAKQVIINLISNALKFTDNGGITVTCKLKDQLNIVRITVADTGRGIKQEDQKYLFKAFGKITPNNVEAQNINIEGIGLGLLISNIIATNLSENKGLEVHSEYGKGTSFSFDLKFYSYFDSPQIISSLKITDFQDQDNESKSLVRICQTEKQKFFFSDKKKSLRCKCNQVLVIEDDHLIQLAIQILFNQQNIQVDQAYKGEESKQKIKERLNQKCCKKYIIIITDIELPDINGIDLTFQIKKLMDTIIVGQSAHLDQKIKTKGLNAGMDDFFEKPLKPTDIEKMIIKYQIKSL